jgi:hypothetical protein
LCIGLLISDQYWLPVLIHGLREIPGPFKGGGKRLL